MKSQVLILFATAVALSMLGSAYAQSDEILKANIPFDFYAGNQKVAAGTYVVRFDPGSDLVRVADDAEQHEVFLIGNKDNEPTGDTSAVIFDHVGDSYFLRGFKNYDADMAFPVKQAETKLAESIPTAEVVVAANGS